jgi:anion-transporting  ArsA/GET3 family ATPase
MKVSGGGEVWGMAVDAKAALIEYLADLLQPRPRRPGAREGGRDRLRDDDRPRRPGRAAHRQGLRGRTPSRRRTAARRRADWQYDAVVLDAPPTGRVGRFLGVNREVADLAKVGPIRAQADSITAMLRSGDSAVHIVTLLEEMPVQETVDAVASSARRSCRWAGSS